MPVKSTPPAELAYVEAAPLAEPAPAQPAHEYILPPLPPKSQAGEKCGYDYETKIVSQCDTGLMCINKGCVDYTRYIKKHTPIRKDPEHDEYDTVVPKREVFRDGEDPYVTPAPLSYQASSDEEDVVDMTYGEEEPLEKVLETETTYETE